MDQELTDYARARILVINDNAVRAAARLARLQAQRARVQAAMENYHREPSDANELMLHRQIFKSKRNV